ncbi:MAG: ATP-binding protein [Vicinamibacterales bacterium]
MGHQSDSLESRLIRAASRYEALASDPGTFLWILDPHLHPTGPNRGWEAYTGQSRQEYVNRGWIDAILESDRARCLAEIESQVPLGRPFTIELSIRRHDGVYRRFHVRAIPVQQPQGAAEWIAVATDVEADRAVADELRSTREPMRLAIAERRALHERLVALTDGAEALLRPAALSEVCRAIGDLAHKVLPADGYVIWSLDLNASVWSAAYSAGLSAPFAGEPVSGTELPFSEPFVADQLDDTFLAHRIEAYRAEGIRSLISVPLPVEGVRRGALVAYYREPHQTTSAELQTAIALGHLAAAAIGNAEHRAREHRLRADAERHSARMAFLAEASALFGDLDFEASFPRLADLAVPTLGEWCAIDVERDGRLHRVAVAHSDAERLALAAQLYERYPVDLEEAVGVANVLRTGRSELYADITDEQMVASARDPEHLRILLALGLRSAIVAPLIARGRTLGVLMLVSATPSRYDDSDRAFVDEVARRAAMAIDNARLYEEARRANRAKDEFLALLSHELRTPLNAIMGWAHVLATRTPEISPGQRRATDVIQRNARLQAELVDSLLDVARVATGGLPLSRQVIDACDIVSAAVEAARPAAADCGLQLAMRAESGACRVLADPTRLQQIVGNLLSNALKFSQRGGRVDVCVRHVERWCELEVADTGIGIEPTFLPHVFERFQQADSSATRERGGLGLGLWLVQELTRAHGGTVEASSPGPGRGARFTVRLPLSTSP